MKISEKLIKIALKLADKKETLKVILEATEENKALSFTYLSVTNSKTKEYIALPLQIKQRQLKNGKQTVLYAQDVNDNNRTKSFILKNISNIKTVENTYKRNRKNKLENFV